MAVEIIHNLKQRIKILIAIILALSIALVACNVYYFARCQNEIEADDEMSKVIDKDSYNRLISKLDDKEKIEQEYLTKKGLKYAYIVGIIMLIIFIYMIVPGLPNSGLLLDMSEKAYVNQLFGENAFFQSGFTYLVSLVFILAGIAYGIGSKTVKNDKECESIKKKEDLKERTKYWN